MVHPAVPDQLVDDMASLKYPHWLAERLDPTWRTRAHHRLIGREIANAVKTGGKLIVTCPPQVGKTTVCAEWTPQWLMSKFPSRRIIVASYGHRLAVRSVRRVRNRIDLYGKRFGVSLASGTAAADEWYTSAGGGVKAIGLGGGITGFPCDGCVSGDTLLTTPEGPVRMDDFVAGGMRQRILAYDHELQVPVFRRVLAAMVTGDKPLVSVHTRSGRTVHCTDDHPFYMPGHGYVAAKDLRPGDRLLTVDRPVPPMPETRLAEVEAMHGLPAGPEESKGRTACVPGVREGLHHSSLRVHEEEGPGSLDGHLLLYVPSSHAEGTENVWPVRGPGRGAAARMRPGMREGRSQEGHGSTRVPPSRAPRPDAFVRDVQGEFQAGELQGALLLASLRERGALAADDRQGQLSLQTWDKLHEVVSLDAPLDLREGGAQMRGLSESRGVYHRDQEGKVASADHDACAPHQRGPEGQPGREPDPDLQDLSCDTPQIADDTVSVVLAVRGIVQPVYDIQVEGASNFIAGGVLVHNCLIIDDYCKNRADADSPVMRENTWEWYSSGLLSRLAPSTPEIVLATRWHPDDLIGRLLKEQGRQDEGGSWRVVHLPAIAELDLTGGSDPLGRQDGDPLTHPNEMLNTREDLLAFWQKRQADTPLVRDWRALYMGDPAERTGALVSWEIIQSATVPPSAVAKPVRIVVAVDPSGGGADEVGIIVAALGDDEKVYLIADASAVIPVTEWPRAACDLAEQHGADRIVLETNFGGRLVEQAIRAAWMSKERSELMPAISEVRALRGKVLRAEPIAQELAMGRVKIVAGLDKLCRQWATYRAGDRDSPGRLDASVYACVALLRTPMEGLASETTRTRRRDAIGGRGGRRLPGR